MPTDDGDFIENLKADEASERARQQALARPKATHTREQDNRKRWLETTFHNVIEDVRQSTTGGRNNRLRWAARRLGEISHGGLDEQRCKRELERAAIDNGLVKDDGIRQCRASIESGWRKGISEPAEIPAATTRSTPANAHSSRSSRTQQRHDEFDPDGEPTKPATAAEARSLSLRSLSTVRSRVPTWIWEYDGIGRIQHGTLTMFAGKPAAGKSTAARWFAARISRGELPGVWFGTPMRVAVMMTEEQTDAVIIPSLVAVGADLRNIFEPQIRIGDMECTIVSVADEQALTQQLIDNEVACLIVDPIMSTMGATADVYRNNEVRAALAPYTRIAKAINGIVIGVTHLRKGEVRDVMDAINGSSAFGEVPRAVFGFAPMQNGLHVMEQVKNSAGPIGLKLEYVLPIEHLQADDGQELDLPRFEIRGETDVSISDIDPANDETTDISVAVEWLRNYLQIEQPAPSVEVKREAKTQGDIKEHTLKRAMRKLKVVVHSSTEPGKPHMTVWSLPGYKQW